jgi:ribosome-binding protein aMBF1 (putative translation factor)
MDEKNWKVYQDYKPVVLTKSNKPKSNISNINKTSIHIKKPDIIDDDEAHRIITYTPEQIKIIVEARNALGLTQKELAQKIHPTITEDFIRNIENGKSKFIKQNYNKILRVLKIK